MLSHPFTRPQAARSAEGLFRQALDVARELYDEEHAYVAITLCGLAAVRQARGDNADAERLFREALAVRQQLHAPNHWQVANAKSALAACLTSLGHYEEAERLLFEGYPVLVSERGEDDPDTRRTLERITALYEAWGKLTQAGRYHALLGEMSAARGTP